MTEPNFRKRFASKRDLFKANFDELDEREQQIVRLRYGIGGGPEKMTLEDVGRRAGVTKQRVHQLEEKAMKKVIKRMKIKKVINRTEKKHG